MLRGGGFSDKSARGHDENISTFSAETDGNLCAFLVSITNSCAVKFDMGQGSEISCILKCEEGKFASATNLRVCSGLHHSDDTSEVLLRFSLRPANTPSAIVLALKHSRQKPRKGNRAVKQAEH